jgi:V8-like Glu-specific endopeptidase
MRQTRPTHASTPQPRTLVAGTAAALVLATSACGVEAADSEAEPASIGTTEDALTSGLHLNLYQLNGIYSAIGRVHGCSATLVSHEAVLTAAHCVCPTISPVGCDTRASFTVDNVRLADNPATAWVDESTLYTPTTMTFSGDVVVHPLFGEAGNAWNDHAIIQLDQPVYRWAADVVPMPIAGPDRRPSLDSWAIIAGYGYTGSVCQTVSSIGRVGNAHIYARDANFIKVDAMGVGGCPGDSGGPIFDGDLVVLGNTYGGVAGQETWYPPIYEEEAWARATIDPLETAADRNHFDVSKGTSWSLGSDANLYQNYWPEVGIVGMGVSPLDGLVYTWYLNRTFSRGRSWDLREHTLQQAFAPAAGYLAKDIVGMGFSTSGHVFAWYKNGKVSVGGPTDLDSDTPPTPYAVTPGRSPEDIVGIDISSSDSVFTWYDDGAFSVGTPTDLDSAAMTTYTPATGKRPTDIVEMAIAETQPGVDRVFTFYKRD